MFSSLHLDVGHRFGIEFLLRLRARRDQTAPLRGWFSRWRWAVGAFHAKSHVKRCLWTHGQYRHEGTAEAQGDGTEVANGFWKQYHNILTALSPALYDATVELIGDWWNEMRNWEIVKILKRNVDTQSKNMIRYGQRLADLEAKYTTMPTKDDITNWRKALEHANAAAASAKATAASKSSTDEVFCMLVTATELSQSLAELNQYTGTLPTTAAEQAKEIDEEKQEALNRIFAGLAVDPSKAMNVNELDRHGQAKRTSTATNDARRLDAAARQRCHLEAKISKAAGPPPLTPVPATITGYLNVRATQPLPLRLDGRWGSGCE